MKKQSIHIEEFELSDSIIDVASIIDGVNTDFKIDRDDFESYCDRNEMREWEEDVYSQVQELSITSEGTIAWEDIYCDRKRMKNFLKDYIEHIINQNPRPARDN